MSGLSIPFKLTDAAIASVLSTNTVSAKLTDAGIAAALSSGTVGAKMAGVGSTDVGAHVYAMGAGGASIIIGANVSGSTLKPYGFQSEFTNGSPNVFSGGGGSGTLPGTWTATGTTVAGGANGPSTLFKRIA